MVAATVLIPLLLAFQRWRRQHHKHLELIASETPPTGQTQGQSVAGMGRNLINRFSVTENWTQTSTPPLLTTARPLETVSEQPASTDRPLDQSTSERGMEPINA